MPSLRQLEYLVALSDARHFGRAAAACSVSQPTLSHQLKALEARLGTPLVERGEMPVRLTPVGREIADRARIILLGVADMKDLARRSGDRPAGTVRFGVSPTLGPYLLPPVVARLHREYPDMRLYMREGIPDEQVAELRRGAIDLLCAPLPLAGEDLAIEPLFRERLHLVVPPDHPLSTGGPVPVEALRGLGILSIDPRHHLHRQLEDICARFGAELLRDYVGTSLDSLRQMAGSGIGLAILPELYLRSEVGGEDMVRRVEIEGWNETRSIAAVLRREAAYGGNYSMIARAIAAEAHRLLEHA